MGYLQFGGGGGKRTLHPDQIRFKVATGLPAIATTTIAGDNIL